MKRNLTCMLLVSMLAAVPLVAQSAPPAGASQTFIAFTGGSVWGQGLNGTCMWYFPVMGDLPLSALFAPDDSGSPKVDMQHAYFLWVSDWTVQDQNIYQNAGFGDSTLPYATMTYAIVPAGTATIYYTEDPATRDLEDPNDRSSWGRPVAKFVRGSGLFQSPDGFQYTDRFFFSAQLVKSQEITLHGQPFNFRSLIPHGMSCFEFGQNMSMTETGSCTAMGN
jgi:hypothetical protein